MRQTSFRPSTHAHLPLRVECWSERGYDYWFPSLPFNITITFSFLLVFTESPSLATKLWPGASKLYLGDFSTFFWFCFVYLYCLRLLVLKIDRYIYKMWGIFRRRQMEGIVGLISIRFSLVFDIQMAQQKRNKLVVSITQERGICKVFVWKAVKINTLKWWEQKTFAWCTDEAA